MIRPAKAEDCEAIHGLILELAEFEKLLDEVTGDAGTLREALFSEKLAAEALVAVDDESGAVVGYAIFFHNFSTFSGRRGLYLEDIYVQPNQRGKGMGKGLLNRVLAIAKERGCPRCDWLVLDWNKRAIEFYESIGAEILGDWKLARFAP